MKRENKKVILILLFSAFLSICAYSAKSKIKFSAISMQGSIKEGQNSTFLTGDAVVVVDTMEIRAERVEIYGKDYRCVKATGGVEGEESGRGCNCSSNFMQYDREKELATFLGNTELNDTKNDVKINSQHIEYNQKAETMLMQFDVKILRKEITCTSIFAMYNRNNSSLSLTGRPIVTKSKDTFKAAKISVNLDTEDISLEGKVSGNVVDEKKEEPTKMDEQEAKDTGETEEIDGKKESEDESSGGDKEKKIETKKEDSSETKEDSESLFGKKQKR